MSDTDSGFRGFLKMAVHRVRVQREINAVSQAFRYLAVALAVGLLSLFLFPRAENLIGLALASFFVIAGALLAVVWLRPVDETRAARTADNRFGLADHALTSEELHSEDGSGWLRLQHKDTLERLRQVDWKASWPLRWPKYSALCGALVLALALSAFLRIALYTPEAPLMAETTGLTENATTIEEILKDWDKAAEETENPELKALLAELQPMREQLPNMKEREMLLTLSKIENKLEAMREAAAKDSLEASAGDMAAAFENVEGMSALSAALKQKNFDKAADLAAKEAEKLSQPGAVTPSGADSASAQEQMSKAAQKLEKSGNAQAASAMQLAKNSGQKKDPSGMCKAMGQLSQCLGKEASRQAACKNLGLQLAQIGQCKACMGQGESMARGMSLLPKLSQSKKPGKGAGSETDLDRFGNPTDSNAARTQENLTGMVGEGESETENMASDTPGGEAPRASKTAQYAQYEKLSQQAIADESLPLAYRETIRRYFESIRPADK